jgi:hypothetical protein
MTLETEYRDCHQYVYVPARGFDGANRKKPTRAWVSDCPDGIDPRTLENPLTRSYQETGDEPCIIVGAVDGYLLDVDIDVGEGHEETYDGSIDDIETPDGSLAFRSPSGGKHWLLKYDRPISNVTPSAGIDVQGDMPGNMGVIASPFHHPEYQIVSEPSERVVINATMFGNYDSLNRRLGALLFESSETAQTPNPGDMQGRPADSVDVSPTPDAGRTGSQNGDSMDSLFDAHTVSGFDEYLTDSDIEAALDAIPQHQSYDDWRDLAFAVHDYDDSIDGKRLFASWSAGGSKWDSKSADWIETFWSHANRGRGITVGWLIEKAESCGWEKPAPPSSDSADSDWDDSNNAGGRGHDRKGVGADK